MQRLRRNVVFGALGFGVPTLVVLLTWPVLTRTLGGVGFGLLTLANSFAGTLQIFGLGLSGAVIRYVSDALGRDDPDEAARSLATALAWYTAAGLAAAVGLAALAPKLALWLAEVEPGSAAAADATAAFRLAAVRAAAAFPSAVFVAFFKGCGRFEWSTLAASLQALLGYGAGAAAALWWGAGVVGVMAMSAGAAVVVLLVSAAVAHRLGARLGIRLSPSRAGGAALRRMLAFGLFLAAVSLCSLLFQEVQRYVAGFALGPAAVAAWALAYAVTSGTHGLVAQATEVLFPLSSGAADLRPVRRVYLRMLAGSAALAAGLLGPLALLAEPFMTFWAGAELGSRAAPLVPPFALGFFFVALSPAPYHLANGIGRPGLNLANLALRAVVNLGLLAAFWWNGLTLGDIVWAFALTALAVDGLVWLPFIEWTVWRPLRRSEAE